MSHLYYKPLRKVNPLTEPTYTVKYAKFKKTWKSNKGIEYQSFDCYFDEIPDAAEVSIPTSEPKLEMGDVLTGELQDGKFGKQLYGSKRVEQATAQPQVSTQSQTHTGTGQSSPIENRLQTSGTPQPIDDRQRSIVRQHSQKVAVEMVRLEMEQGKTSETATVQGRLEYWSDYFVAHHDRTLADNQVTPQTPSNGHITPDQALSLAEQAKAAGMRPHLLSLALKEYSVDAGEDPFKALANLTPSQAAEFTAEYLS